MLAEANRILNVVFAASMAIGPALAGIAVAAVGPACALALDGASFAAAGMLLARAGTPAAAPASRVGLRVALARVRDAGTIMPLLALEGAIAVFLALITPVELVFVTGTLGGSEADFGIVLAAWGIGGVLGGIALTRLDPRPPDQVLLAAFAVMVAGYLGMGVATGVAMVIACSLLGGLGQGLEGCALLTAVQSRTPCDLQPHVSALTEAARTAPGIGFVAGGLLAASVSPRVTYIVAGFGALAVVVASVRVLCDAVGEGAPGLQAA